MNLRNFHVISYLHRTLICPSGHLLPKGEEDMEKIYLEICIAISTRRLE